LPHQKATDGEARRQSVESNGYQDFSQFNETGRGSQFNSTSKKGRGGGSCYVPGGSKFEPETKLRTLLEDNSHLKMHQTKKWLKQKVQFNKFKKENPEAEEMVNPYMKTPDVKKKYLMSDQEIK
jgi:hypothetical protein